MNNKHFKRLKYTVLGEREHMMIQKARATA